MSLRHFPPSLLSPGSPAAPAARSDARPGGSSAGEPVTQMDAEEQLRRLRVENEHLREAYRLTCLGLEMAADRFKIGVAGSPYWAAGEILARRYLDYARVEMLGSWTLTPVAAETGDAEC
jgi:hypothetical protein